jgi:hypothetical protein
MVFPVKMGGAELYFPNNDKEYVTVEELTDLGIIVHTTNDVTLCIPWSAIGYVQTHPFTRIVMQ